MFKLRKICMLASMFIFTLSICNLNVLADSSETITLDNYEAQIMEEVENLTGFSTDNAKVITLNNENSLTKTTKKEKAIKITTGDCVTVIIPKIAENDEIVNSFDYAETKLLSRDDNAPISLVGVTLNISAYFNTTYIHNTLVGILYTPKSVYFSWNATNSTAKVNDVIVNFESKGDYWKISPLTDMGYEKTTSFSVAKTNPTKDTAYGDWAQTMNDNYGIECTIWREHVGLVTYEIAYNVNGTLKYDEGNYNVFGK